MADQFLDHVGKQDTICKGINWPYSVKLVAQRIGDKDKGEIEDITFEVPYDASKAGIQFSGIYPEEIEKCVVFIIVHIEDHYTFSAMIRVRTKEGSEIDFCNCGSIEPINMTSRQELCDLAGRVDVSSEYVRELIGWPQEDE